MMLKLRDVSVKIGAELIVDRASFSLSEGQWLMLCGPNGAGKSTLIKAISQSVKYEGTITVMGRDARKYTPNEYARCVGVLAQTNSVGYAFTVGELVEMGRYAHARGFLSRRDDSGAEAVARAIADVGLTEKRGQSILTLSGGETQRAFLAQAFAQEPMILLLDEPANHLDLIYQKSLFAAISEWLKTPGRAVVSVVHDLSLAKKYGTRALLMNSGRIAARGVPSAALSGKNLETVYGMDVQSWMRDMLAQWE